MDEPPPVISARELAEHIGGVSEAYARELMRANGIAAVRGYPRGPALQAADSRPGKGARTDLDKPPIVIVSRLRDDTPPALRIQASWRGHTAETTTTESNLVDNAHGAADELPAAIARMATVAGITLKQALAAAVEALRVDGSIEGQER